MAPRFRVATAADAEALGRSVIEGFEVYREFSPPGVAQVREPGVAGVPLAGPDLVIVEYRYALRD